MDNWDRITTELRSTKREGIEDLIKFLESTDFKVAPASTKFHLNITSGLMQHSLNALRFARAINKDTEAGYSDDSLVLCGLLHDLCKVNFYTLGEEWDKEHKDKTNQWRKKAVYKVDDVVPLGHGEKSVILAVKHIDLTTEEMAAIRWHMAFSDPGTHFLYPSGGPFRTALDKYPLVKIIIMADQMAEMFETLPKETA